MIIDRETGILEGSPTVEAASISIDLPQRRYHERAREIRMLGTNNLGVADVMLNRSGKHKM
jgi:hypothetical protein